jgi:hypothetical protein
VTTQTFTKAELDALLRETVEAEHRCTVHDYAEMSRLDHWVERDGAVVAVGESKTRPDVTCKDYPTALLDLSKWQNALAQEWSTGLPALVWYAWACGCVGEIRPAAGVDVKVTITTPGPDSRSLNKGVARPTVNIPVPAFKWLNLGCL